MAQLRKVFEPLPSGRDSRLRCQSPTFGQHVQCRMAYA
jgi:hypothetical protein